MTSRSSCQIFSPAQRSPQPAAAEKETPQAAFGFMPLFRSPIRPPILFTLFPIQILILVISQGTPDLYSEKNCAQTNPTPDTGVLPLLYLYWPLFLTGPCAHRSKPATQHVVHLFECVSELLARFQQRATHSPLAHVKTSKISLVWGATVVATVTSR